MSRPLQFHRLFDPAATLPPEAEGLALSAFHAGGSQRQPSAPFQGTAAASINAAEVFYEDALGFLRERHIRIPSPFGPDTLSTSDIVACPSTPWPTVPLYVARFAASEPVALVKRGLSWCMDLGLVFPRRRLFVSLQTQDRFIGQDQDDVAQLERWFKAQGVAAFEPESPSDRTPCLLLTSEHFAHHMWNELSVLDGLLGARASASFRVLACGQPVAPIADLFPELSPTLIEVTGRSPDEVMREALSRRWAIIPAGRRFLPATVVERILRVARRDRPDVAAAAEEFRARHPVVVWLTLRVDVRTATNLVDALTALVVSLRSRYPGLGVIIDGFTTPADSGPDWNRDLIAAETRALTTLWSALGPVDRVSLVGRSNADAFIWATAADYYVCPYGSAHHKVAWINPIPGTIHAGENKRPVSHTDAGLYARQVGPEPQFYFSEAIRRDVTHDHRTDLVSYELNQQAFREAVLVDIDARVNPRRTP